MKIFDIKTVEQLVNVPKTNFDFKMFNEKCSYLKENSQPEILSVKIELDNRSWLTRKYVGTWLKIEIFQYYFSYEKHLAFLSALFCYLGCDIFENYLLSGEGRRHGEYIFAFAPKSEELFNSTFGDVPKEKTIEYKYFEKKNIFGWVDKW